MRQLFFGSQRLRIDTRKWTLARMDPKKYGDETRIVGAGGEALIPPDMSTPQSRLEGARRLAFLLAEAAHLGPQPSAPLQLENKPQASIDLYGKPMQRPWN